MPDDHLISRFHELADRHCNQHNADTLCVFLRIHACICDRVKTSQDGEVAKLNHLFIQKCIDVYDHFQVGPIDPLPTAWVMAFYAYLENASDYGVVHPLIVVAHIIEDLGSVLCYVEIEKKDYDAVFEHVIECVDQVRRSSDYVPQDLKQLVLDALANELFADVRNRTVKSLRNFAWAVGQKRKHLTKRTNLARFFQSGWPRQWVEVHGGNWTHEDWSGFITEIKDSEYWPVDPEEVGFVLEQLKRELDPDS